MSKPVKRGKSGDVKTGTLGGGKWDLALTSAVFQEESWSPCLTWIVGREAEDYKHIDALNNIAQAGTRKLFSIITRDQLYVDVCELGNPKNKKVKEVPPNSEVCEACKPYLDIGEQIPPPLLAKLIKWKLMGIKATDVKRRDLEAKLEKSSRLNSAGSDKKKGKDDKGKERAKSPKKGGKKTPEPQTAKEGSKLKKRGEEDGDSRYIDDEPDDGAHHYFLLSGFHNPQVFQYLEEVGVTVSSVIGVSSQDYDRLRRPEIATSAGALKKRDVSFLKDLNLQIETLEKTDPIGNSQLIKMKKAELEIKLRDVPNPEMEKEADLRKELKVFWKDLLPVIQRLSDSSSLHDIARLDYEVKAIIYPTDSSDAEQKVQYASALFEDIAVMIYDLLDAKRLYKTFLDNLNLVRVQSYGQEEVPTDTPMPPATPMMASSKADNIGENVSSLDKEKSVPPPVDMRFYNDLMNTIPQESTSVSLMMHCMLEQICATEEGTEPPSEQAPPARSDGLNFNIACYLTDVALRLGLTEKEHNLLSDVLELPKPPPDQPGPPELVNIQDGISIRTLHLKPHYGFDAGAVERAMLQFLPFAHMMRSQRPTSAETRLRAARLQELIHFCATNGLSKSEIDRAFKQFVFESMDLTSTDSNGFLIEKGKEGIETTAIPWDDPYPYFKIMVPTDRAKSESKALEIPSPSLDRSELSSVKSDRSDGKDGKYSKDKKYNQRQPSLIRNASGNVDGKPIKTTKESEIKLQSNALLIVEVTLGNGACSPDTADPTNTRVSTGRASPRPSSTDSKKGILISRKGSSDAGSISPKQSRSNSVHWDVATMIEDSEVETHGTEPNTISQSMMEVVEAQQRNLDQWCFAEHFKPHILAQILSDASYHLPFCETYQHKRDNTTMIVMHNPYNTELQNHIDWHKEVHSNMGFRNYLEYTAESITEWLKEKEAEYQAMTLSKEVEGIVKEEEEKNKPEEPKGKGKKSPRKSPTRTRSKSPKGSRSSSQERICSANSNPYIREGSLKQLAWQAEQERIAAEEEEKDKANKEKRAKSAERRNTKVGLRSRASIGNEEKAKSPRGSAKSSKSRLAHADSSDVKPSEALIESTPYIPEKFWPFSGYDTGNQLIHVSGITTSLFPSDGGRIKTERTEFVQGTIAIRSVLQKDDHIFAVHVLNPREDMNLSDDLETTMQQNEYLDDNAEKSETEKTEKESSSATTREKSAEDVDLEAKNRKPAVSQFGSVTAQLSDGMVLALSQFGSKGNSYLKPYEPAQYVPTPLTESPSLVTTASPSKAKKDAKRGVPTPEPEKLPEYGASPKKHYRGVEEEPTEEEKKDDEKPLPKQEFQELFVTCPDGLTVKYFLQSSVGVTPNSFEERQLAVKQSYPFKTKGVQECESQRKKYMHTEVSRVITADGSVVKNMVDGSVEVLSADGTVSVFTGQWSLPHSRSSSPARSVQSPIQTDRATPTKKGKGASAKKQSKTQQEIDHEEEVKIVNQGNWVITYPSGERLNVNKETKACEELPPVPICLATDPDSQQTMATRDDNVVTVSYPDGTTVVEHGDGTRITVYYRESAINSSDTDMESPAEVATQTLKFVKVECPAFATVEFNTSTSENLTVFGSGTSINVFPDGYYILHHSVGGRVEVDTEGTMVYFPRRSRFLEHLMPERELQYVMRHNADVIMETVDPDGNVFNVRSTGDFNVIPAQGDDAMSDDSDDHPNKDKKITQYGQHAPRFFIIHADGSGTELLRYQDVAEYLMMSEQNPATAVLKDSLPEHPGVTGITILKPYLSGLSEKWFKRYDQESIVPQGIRCRDLKTLPPKEFKKPGPQFGTNVGRGLHIGASTKGPTRIPILKCPNKLELRQVVQYRPVSEELRSRLHSGLREYAETVVTRLRAEALMCVGDPRSEDEKILAQDLKVLADAQKREARDFEPDHVKTVYEKAVAPPPPSPPQTPQAKRTLADWERDRREIQEEKDAKKKLANGIIESYFESELGKAFLLTQSSDMDEMMRQLADDPSHQGDSRLTYTDTPVYTQAQPQSQQGVSVMSDRSATSESPATNTHPKNGQETPLSIAGAMSEAPTMTPSGSMRPGNPTPAHAGGQGSPAPLRPKNPTPAHAGKMTTDRPEKTKVNYKVDSKTKNTEIKSTDRELHQYQALTTNVIGEPRGQPVPLPVSIKGGRPGAQPNIRYKQTEDPVRRRVNNSLVAGATVKGKQQLGLMRGLICQPEGVNFGVLKEGCTYAFTVTLRNTGLDTCRFKVRQPPPATGLRCVFKPGPVAAGMSVELSLELYAIANGVEGESGVGSLGHVLEIVTETHLLEVPIVATILTAHEYDNPELSPSELRECHARLISTRPPASSGIIRPRRDQKLTAMVTS